MPRTIRLSKQFYDRFGDEVVDEMINLFNSVDDSSRSSLTELNENNFARFDAKLEQRFTEQNAMLEHRFAKQNANIAELGAKIEKRFAEQDVRISQLEVTVERALKDQTRWMFFAWSTLLIAIIGLWARG